MAENSKIQWTSHTFNPWRGCTKISAGCKHCYADALSARNPKTLGVWGPQGTRVVAAESQWKLPLKWNKAAACSCGGGFSGTHSPYCPQSDRPRVFCASLADVFEDWAGPMVDASGNQLWHYSDGGYWLPTAEQYRRGKEPPLTMQDVRARLFALIDATPNLDWLLLTKRPENAASMYRAAFHANQAARDPDPRNAQPCEWPRNVWLGSSVENQATADERMPHLLRVPSAVRFLSCEPLLGPVDLTNVPLYAPCSARPMGSCLERSADGIRIDWVIVGGESGPGARPCRVEWVRSIVQQCKAAGVACFVKQLGSKPDADYYRDRDHYENEGIDWPTPHGWTPHDGQPVIGSRVTLPLADRKGGTPDEWPFDLRVREFPTSNLERQPS